MKGDGKKAAFTIAVRASLCKMTNKHVSEAVFTLV